MTLVQLIGKKKYICSCYISCILTNTAVWLQVFAFTVLECG